MIGGQDAERKLDMRAAYHIVNKQQIPSAQKKRYGQNGAKIGAGQHARDMGNEEPDPANDSADTDGRRRHQRGRKDDHEAHALNIDSQRHGLFFAKGKHVDLPAKRVKNQEGESRAEGWPARHPFVQLGITRPGARR